MRTTGGTGPHPTKAGAGGPGARGGRPAGELRGHRNREHRRHRAGAAGARARRDARPGRLELADLLAQPGARGSWAPLREWWLTAPSRQTSSTAPEASRTVTSSTSRAPSRTAMYTRIPGGRRPLATASGSAGVAATVVRAPVALTSTVRAPAGSAPKAHVRPKTGSKVGLHEAPGQRARACARARQPGGDVAARAAPAAGHGEEDADRTHGTVVARRRGQAPLHAARGPARDVSSIRRCDRAHAERSSWPRSARIASGSRPLTPPPPRRARGDRAPRPAHAAHATRGPAPPARRSPAARR